VPTILFIDDDPHVRRTLGEYFERLGYRVYRASSGAEGIATWNEVRPDVTVLDLYMPEMDGLEVLEQLRRKKAAVIMLTAYGQIESAVEAMRRGAENFLTKPVEMSHLVLAVEKAVEKTKLRQELADLKRRIAPDLKRQLLRALLIIALIAISVALGRWIGGAGDDGRPRAPVTVPVDSAPPRTNPGESATEP
jgi:DNA-binding NtrC family response regulator